MLVALIDAAQRAGADMSSVRRIMSGGSMVAPELCRQSQATFGAAVQIDYGQTETSPLITLAWYDDSERDLTETIGQPIPHVRCRSAARRPTRSYRSARRARSAPVDT